METVRFQNGYPGVAPNGYGSEHPNPYLREHIVLRNRDFPDIGKLDEYMRLGGYEVARKALTTMEPAAVIDEIKKSGLRGRGGAGFPTGVKWGFIPKDIYPNYLVCNADESEPGTFNNHEIIDNNPHQLIEGMIIAGFAVGSGDRLYLYSRRVCLRRAGARARDRRGLRQRLSGHRTYGAASSTSTCTCIAAPARISAAKKRRCSNRWKARSASRASSRRFRPSPACMLKPTVVNNVETLTNVPMIVERGADWYPHLRHRKVPGTKAVSLCGHIRRARQLRDPARHDAAAVDLFDLGGGIRDGHAAQVRRSRRRVGQLADQYRRAPRHADDLGRHAAKGTMLGSGAIMVLDDTVPVVEAALKIDEFFKHESCGKCTPCREGTHFLVNVLGAHRRGPRPRQRYPAAQRSGQGNARQLLLPAGRFGRVGRLARRSSTSSPSYARRSRAGGPYTPTGMEWKPRTVEASAKRGCGA